MESETVTVTTGGPQEGAKEAPKAAPDAAKEVTQGQQPAGEGNPTKAPEGAQEATGEAVAAPLSDLTAKPAEAAPGEPAKGEDQIAAEKSVGFDLTKYSDEYASGGALSDESYKELEAKGFSRDTVDTFVEGVKAKAQVRADTLASAVGGVDNYNAIITWGKSALTDAEKAQAVKALSNPDAEFAKTYLTGLNARFVKEHGKAPGKMSGGGGPSPEEVFKDRSEQAKAMADPRYSKDPKYRNEVIQKSMRSFRASGAKKRTKAAVKKTARSSTRRRAK